MARLPRLAKQLLKEKKGTVLNDLASAVVIYPKRYPDENEDLEGWKIC